LVILFVEIGTIPESQCILTTFVGKGRGRIGTEHPLKDLPPNLPKKEHVLGSTDESLLKVVKDWNFGWRGMDIQDSDTGSCVRHCGYLVVGLLVLNAHSQPGPGARYKFHIRPPLELENDPRLVILHFRQVFIDSGGPLPITSPAGRPNVAPSTHPGLVLPVINPNEPHPTDDPCTDLTLELPGSWGERPTPGSTSRQGRE
jgi:hypothetical protein